MNAAISVYHILPTQLRDLVLKMWLRAWSTNSVCQQSTTLERVNSVHHLSSCLQETLKVGDHCYHSLHSILHRDYKLQH